MKKLSLICALLLVACSSSNDDDRPAPEPPAPPLDAFFAQVTTVVAALPDEGEAATVEALVPTAPEDSEPLGL